MRLYFLRHGLAGHRHDWQGDDAERPLTSEGKKKMAREAKHIARLDLQPELILSSPLVRAFQTAEIVADELGLQEQLLKDERLEPGFGPEQLSEIIRTHSNAGNLMLVGHEPDLSQTVGALVGGARLEMKKGALACVDLPDPTQLAGELLWLLPPSVLAE